MQSRKKENPKNSSLFISQALSSTLRTPHSNSPTEVKIKNNYLSKVKDQKKQLISMHQAVLSGDLDRLKKMIEKNPKLLLRKLNETECESIKGPSGHKASLTVYRSALATEDTQMSSLIKNQLVGMGEEESADKQFNQQFPKKWQAIEKKKWAPIFTQLRKVTHAIQDVEPGDIKLTKHPRYALQLKEGSYVATTLIQFRMLLDKTLSEKAIIGRHFNPNLLLKAFKIYNNNPVFQPNKFKYKKYNLQAFLFWQQVIGYIQRFMPANYVQALCDGAPSTLQCLQKDEPQNRLFNFIIYYAEKNKGIDSQFYPLSSSRLGFDFALYPIGGGNMEPEGLAADCNPNWADVSYGLPEYIQQKEKDMRNLINTKPSQTLSKRFK